MLTTCPFARLLLTVAALVCPSLVWAAALPGGGTAQTVGPATDGRTSDILSDLSKDWFKKEWRAYRSKFVSPAGRVIDNANGDVSHSEGQGYGMLLALAAGDATSFETIWRWTTDNLQNRSDALFAWKWDPELRKTADTNNASDGDVLIAWALVRAAKAFGRPDYEVEARRIVQAIAAEVIVSHKNSVLLLPAAAGFGAADQSDGPVVNLSYYVFAAFRDLAPLAPQVNWVGLRRSGFRLLDQSRFGPLRLPTNWIGLGASTPAPATNFAAQFGYDAVRIPLYLAQDPDAPREALTRFATRDVYSPGAADPAVIDAPTGAIKQTMQGAGYRMVFALARCVVQGDAIPPDLMSTRDGFYYPETLRLLCISVLQERLPQCL